LPEIVARLADDLSGMAAVITHPYEHGHPDHDTAALAVALACETLVARGEAPPERLEFASYHLDGNGPVLGRFRPDSGPPDAALVLTPAQLAMKQQALACFRIQAAFIAQFPLTPERLRPAPTYDFTAAPGPALYDQFGWRVSAAAWRAEAKEILEQCL
jgi:LmbE family N-acetylglucosaminyl deacetylase